MSMNRRDQGSRDGAVRVGIMPNHHDSREKTCSCRAGEMIGWKVFRCRKWRTALRPLRRPDGNLQRRKTVTIVSGNGHRVRIDAHRVEIAARESVGRLAEIAGGVLPPG